MIFENAAQVDKPPMCKCVHLVTLQSCNFSNLKTSSICSICAILALTTNLLQGPLMGSG